MKTIKLILFLTTLTIYSTLVAQFNPITNLTFEQTYSYNSYCPSYNCFNLSWDMPESSEDNLKGFNIYKNSEFWIFTESISLSCSEGSPCEYSNIYENTPFWFSVKAVYNDDYMESEVDDSVFVEGLFTNINKIDKNEIILFKNPISKGEEIKLLTPNLESYTCTVKIYSITGQLINSNNFNQVIDNTICISTRNMTRGLYILHLISPDNNISKKLLIE